MPRENRSQGRAEARDVAAQAEAHSQTRNVFLLAQKKTFVVVIMIINRLTLFCLN